MREIQNSVAKVTVTWWALWGVAITVFSLVVFGRWLLSPIQFQPVPLPAAVMSSDAIARIRVLEGVSTFVALAALWVWLVRPWRRDGRAPIQGLVMLGALVGYVFDTTINLDSYVMAWNVHSVNFGTWAAFFPGHTGPVRYAEALLWGPPMYVYFGTLLGALQFAVLRTLRPRTGFSIAAILSFVAAFVFDLIAEVSIIRFTEAYAWARVWGVLSLWPGQQWQFPLYESLLVAAYSSLYLWHQQSVDSQGETFIERGAKQLPPRWQLPLRTLAAFGFAAVPILVYFGGFYLFSLAADVSAPLPAYLLPSD